MDHPIPKPQIVLPSDKISIVVNSLASVIGLWNNMSIIQVPKFAFVVLAAKNANVVNGSKLFLKYSGHSLLFGVPGYGYWRLIV